VQVLIALLLLLCAVAGPAGAQTIALPDGHELSSPERHPFALSADGARLVYLARTTVFVKPVGAGEPMVVQGPLPGRNKSNPIFSPDGRSILYWATDGSMLERVPVGGGTPVKVARVANPLGMSWGADDRVLVGQGTNGIVAVPAASGAGGAVETVIALGAGEAARDPQMLPDGEHVLFTLGQGTPVNWEQSRIVVQSTRTRARTELVPGRDAHYVRSGHLVYVAGSRVMAAAFDASARRVTSAPAVIAEGVRLEESTGSALISVATNGALAFADARPAPIQLAWVTLDGRKTDLGEMPNGGSAPRLAADGKQVVFRNQGTREIYVGDMSNLAAARRVLTDATLPALSPDGQWMVFGSLGTSRRADRAEVLYRIRADGSGEPELLANPGRAPEQWSAADRFTFITYRDPVDYDLWLYRVSEKRVEPLATLPGSAQLSGSFSPDGQWFSYQSNEVNGEWQIFVQPYPTDGRKFQVTTAGGRAPAWASDNQLIFDGDGQMLSVTIDFSGSTPRFSAPRELPIVGMIQRALRRNWDLTRATGEPRLLMQFQAGPRLNVVTNWQDTLLASSGRNE
jgi:Tol biopolymer transport system component